MEGKIIDTFRLILIDIDQSYNIPVADTASQGYMVVRAPKGTTEAVYFAKGSTNQIKAMIGNPTADWPDIQDALDLNGNFGLWISAPPGSSADYPSYYGGTYITKQGLFPFYEVTDKTAPTFRTLLNIENEIAGYLHTANGVPAVLKPVYRDDDGNTSGQDYIKITGIPAKVLAVADSIRFSFWGNSGSTAYSDPRVYELNLNGTTVQTANPVGGALTTVGSISNGTEIRITGTTGTTSFMYIDFDQLRDSTTYRASNWPGSNKVEYTSLLHGDLLALLQWIIDVKNDTYMSISQKSPTEKITSIKITDIGYDKYVYDLALDSYVDKIYWESHTPGSGTPYYPIASDVENASGLYLQFFSNDYLAAHPGAKIGVYQSTGATTVPTNVTSQYRNRYIRVANAGYMRNDVAPSGTITGRDTAAINTVDRIYYINSDDTISLVRTSITQNGVIAARNASNYNTITFSVNEDVIPGDNKSGGTFTGSLSETGKDTFGGDIYFKNVIPENAMSFIDVEVYKTFDADVSTSSGFFTGYRICDSKMYGSSATVTTTLTGQRYVTSVVNDLVSTGTTGGILDTRFNGALVDGWTEAAKTAYEGVYVFAEPTGTESLKSTLYNLRQSSHKLATFVSPRLITAAEALDPTSITVSGRITGTAQPVNEALRRDTYTGKKYWTSLIGAYASKLLSIIDGKMGGWAPMFTDIGGFGGQLPVTVERMKYEFTADQLEILDEKGLNPIILDPTYGVMVVSQKTTQDPDNLSDWSYLGHSMAFDLFKREVRDNVMIPQIGKPNDSYYQAMRQRQVEAILNRRTGGSQPIWAAGKVEVANVNTADVKAQRKFAIRVSVKVNVFSEWVELTFINVAQQTQL